MAAARAELQQKKYSFPYHWLASFVAGVPFFSSTLSFGPSYLAGFQLVFHFLQRQLLERGSEADKRGFRFVDFGCGDGRLVGELENDLRYSAVRFFGVDSDPDALMWAGRLAGNPSRFHQSVDDLDTDFADAASLIEVLEHIEIEEVAPFLHSVSKVLKPDAKLLLTVPSSEKPTNPKHVRHFDYKSLEKAVWPHFEVVSRYGFDKVDWETRVIRRIIFGSRWHFHHKSLNRRLVNKLAKTHTSLKGCGRIVAVVRKADGEPGPRVLGAQ